MPAGTQPSSSSSSSLLWVIVALLSPQAFPFVCQAGGAAAAAAVCSCSDSHSLPGAHIVVTFASSVIYL